jgi:hypothetical protein
MEENMKRWKRYGDGLREEMKKKHERQRNCLEERLDREWRVVEPASMSEQNHCKHVIQIHVRRKEEVKGSRVDLGSPTIREVQKARRDHWPQLTARREIGSKPTSPGRRPPQ